MSQAVLTAERVQITFGADPLSVEQVVHRATGRVVCRGGEQRVLVRMPHRLSDPLFLTHVVSAEATAEHVACVLADDGGEVRAHLQIRAGAHGLHFHVEVAALEPPWMVEWKLYGLALEEVIIPALGGQTLTRAMPAGQQLSYKYPFWWNAQFALASLGEAGGLWLQTRRADPGFEVLRVHKLDEDPDRFALGLGFEADAPLRHHTLAAAWCLDGYDGSWQAPVDRHRQWLQETFALVPYHEHPHFPAWAGDIDFVLEIWGMRKDQGRPAHTFDDMIDRIRAFAALHPPARTLLYLPGFAEGGIDSNIPDYAPSPQLGGRAAFGRLVEAAHALGYRVMIHTNVLGMTYTHPRYPAFKPHQVVDVFDRPMGWGMDMDGDWLPEPYFAYINPGAEAWGALMEEVIGDLVRSFDLDAVFLDQTLLAFNVSRGPSFVAGMRTHVQRLQRAFPGVLFAGEGLHEQVLPVLPMAQIHGIDSLTEVHGLEGQEPWRRVHPVSTYLFGPYTRFVAHLLTRHPSSSLFQLQEEAYAALGVVPALVLYRASHDVDRPEVQRMLERARRLGQARAAR